VAHTAQIGVKADYLYAALITHFGDTEYLTSQATDRMLGIDIAITGFVAGCIQGFFAWRIKLLIRSLGWILFPVILASSAMSFVVGIATAVLMGMIPKSGTFRIIFSIWLSSLSIADVVITASLVVFLRNHKTGYAKTDNQIDRIMRLTVQTGLVTAVWALINLITFLSRHRTDIYLIFGFALAQLYTNSLLSNLNARRGWTSKDDQETYPSSVSEMKLGSPDVTTLPEVHYT